MVIALDDAFHLGVSEQPGPCGVCAGGGRVAWCRQRPGVREVALLRPVPISRLATQAAQERIRKIAEELDAHRKRVQAQNPGLTLTGMYNVLEKLRAGEALDAKEKQIHDAGLVSVLRQLHDDLDAAVFAAYGWPATLTDAEILDASSR